MKYFIYIVGMVMILTGCAGSNQETIGGSSHEESTETASHSIDLADIETMLAINPTKENVTFHITFKNNATKPVEFTFSSGQKFEIVVKNEAGQEVYRFSEGKMFTMALEMLKLEAGEQVTFEDVWDYKKENAPVAPGKYEVVASVIPIEMDGDKLDKDIFTAKGSFTIEEIAATQANDEKPNQEVENSAFRNIKATGTKGEYVVTGEARVFEAVFLYTVEDGHHQLVKETPVYADQGAPEWSPFKLEISIPKDQLPDRGTLTAHIYERSAKDGSVVNSYFVTLEEF